MTGRWVVLCFRKQSIILEVSKEKPIFKTSFLDTYARKIANKFDIMENIKSSKGEIVMYQPDETIRLEVRVQ